MLKKKLFGHSLKRPTDSSTSQVASVDNAMTSEFFGKTLWKEFYELECELNDDLRELQPPAPIAYVYNPVEYACEIHCGYLQRYLDGPKRLIFVGMNPGPNGMNQTGVPFGNVTTVRETMQLSGDVLQPPLVHPKRPVTGLNCQRDEPSGVRIWGLLQRLAGESLETFARQCFVHNFCPLTFFDKNGKNLTPSDLKGSEYKTQVRDMCLKALDKQIDLLHPEVIVAVGDYVFTAIKKSVHVKTVKILKMPHPSPRAVNNHDWPEKAERFLRENDLIKYICNQ